MKKIFKKLTAFSCLLVLIFSFSGCSQFFDLTGNGSYKEVSITMQLQKQMIFCDTGETYSTDTPVSVSFGVDSSATEVSSSEAAQRVMYSVVSIVVTSSGYASSASGVIVDIRGGLNANEYYILTCHHVIESGGNISVYLADSDGRNKGDYGYDDNYVFTGSIGESKQIDQNNSVCLVGGDKDGDIAVLKLKVGDRKDRYGDAVLVEKATFPNPNTISVAYGEEVFAIGNPSGNLPMTYLHGYISYLDRTAQFESVGIMTNLIQHDCAITHGSSGGGLFNMKGQLIGITNGGISSQVGLSYAIPYYTTTEYGFMHIAKQLIENNSTVNYGYVKGRWELGILVSETESKVKGSSLLIEQIKSNSNAYGKLKIGDYITEIEFMNTKYSITSRDSFASAIFLAKESLTTQSEIKLTVQRAM